MIFSIEMRLLFKTIQYLSNGRTMQNRNVMSCEARRPGADISCSWNILELRWWNCSASPCQLSGAHHPKEGGQHMAIERCNNLEVLMLVYGWYFILWTSYWGELHCASKRIQWASIKNWLVISGQPPLPRSPDRLGTFRISGKLAKRSIKRSAGTKSITWSSVLSL